MAVYNRDLPGLAKGEMPAEPGSNQLQVPQGTSGAKSGLKDLLGNMNFSSDLGDNMGKAPPIPMPMQGGPSAPPPGTQGPAMQNGAFYSMPQSRLSTTPPPIPMPPPMMGGTAGGSYSGGNYV